MDNSSIPVTFEKKGGREGGRNRAEENEGREEGMERGRKDEDREGGGGKKGRGRRRT